MSRARTCSQRDAVFIALAIFGLLQSSLAQIPKFRSDVNLVTVTFTVRDADGRLVGDLTQNDIEVLEDGVPQRIRFFARANDVPLSIGLIVDASDSQSKFIHRHHADVERFLHDVLSSRDQAFLVCFGNHVRLVSDFSSSPSEIMENLDKFDHNKATFPEIGTRDVREEGTAFYDAIVYSVDEKLSSASQGHRALILFSDGQDNSSAHHMLDAIEGAQREDVLVYSVRYTENRRHLKARDKYGMSVMQRISRDTGAADFDASRGDLDPAFRSIGSELRALYEVGYHATGLQHDGTFHKVVVRSNRPELHVRAKAGYFAEK